MNERGKEAFYAKEISVIANVESKEKLFKRPKNGLPYGHISVTGGSVIAGFNCIFNPAFKRTSLIDANQ